MIDELRGAGYGGPIAVRVNPGFGHGHVQSCDTGGPSSKHGIWHEALAELRARAATAKLPIVALHAHVGTGPQIQEFDDNLRRFVELVAGTLPQFPDVEAVNLGGGIPHPYRPGRRPLRPRRLSRAAGRGGRRGWRRRRGVRSASRSSPAAIPSRARACSSAASRTSSRRETNAKGPGQKFIMVDAGFNDLVRPAMYGAYHHISIVGRGAGRAEEPFVVAGPLCESGDVFTRDEHELLDPRPLPRPEVGDLLVLHDAGAYGAAMSSNYVSIGRAPQVFWDDGRATLVSRRETLDDVVRAECNEPINTPAA